MVQVEKITYVYFTGCLVLMTVPQQVLLFQYLYLLQFCVCFFGASAKNSVLNRADVDTIK